MQEWLRYYGNKKGLKVEELKHELMLQRYVRRMLDKEIGRAKKELAKGFSRISSEQQREIRIEYFTMLYKIVDGVIRDIEEKLGRKKTSGRCDNYAKLWNKAKNYYPRINRIEPIETVWNYDAFLTIAEDRGYKVKEALFNDISKELNIPYTHVEKLMRNGRFTWGQVLLLGMMLEMTPREFAETFMRGYFEEISEGQFRAWGDKEQFEYRPLPRKEKPTIDEPPEVILVDGDGEPIAEIDAGKAVFDEDNIEWYR